MHTLILACAGESTRFPNYRPKWSLTHPSGHMMAAEAMRGTGGYSRVVVAMRGQHLARYGTDAVLREFDLAGIAGVEIVDVGETHHQVESVQRAIRRASVEGGFTIKDCDNRFQYSCPPGQNAIAVVDLHTCINITPGNKSYVRVVGDRVLDVQERQILSPLFCCGAYTFADSDVFMQASRECRYVSEVLCAIASTQLVRTITVEGYVDWGTAADWESYLRTFKTLFCDIDGVLVESSHRSFTPTWGNTALIAENVARLNALYDTGRVEVILTTAREEAYRGTTMEQLAGVRYHRLVMGLHGGARVVVNDYQPTRGEQTCFAVNLPRNSATLAQALKGLV